MFYAMRVSRVSIVAAVAALALPAIARAEPMIGSELEASRSAPRRVSAIARVAAIPGALFSPFYEEHSSTIGDENWNEAWGLQLGWELEEGYELGLAIDHADLSMPTRAWLASGDDLDDATLNELDLSAWSFVLTTYWSWSPLPWLEPFLGAGLGVAWVSGDPTEYQIRSDSACRARLGEGDEFTPGACLGEGGGAAPEAIAAGGGEPLGVPSVVPVLHAAGGVRFRIGPWASAQFDVGINNYAYAGFGLGAHF